jgi:hypothetical protein
LLAAGCWLLVVCCVFRISACLPLPLLPALPRAAWLEHPPADLRYQAPSAKRTGHALPLRSSQHSNTQLSQQHAVISNQ